MLFSISAEAHEISDDDLGVAHEATALAKREWPRLCARLVEDRLPLPIPPRPVCIDAREGIYVSQRFDCASPKAQSLWEKFAYVVDLRAASGKL